MIKEAIYHRSVDEFIYPIARNHLVVRLRTACKDMKKCSVIIWDRTMPNIKKEVPLQCKQRDDLFDYFEGEILFSQIARYHKYCFCLEDHQGSMEYYGSNGFTEIIPFEGAFEYLYANEKDVLHLPQWTEGTIYYQIFPERFQNGNKENDPPNCEPWGSKPTRENYMGGDIAGICEKLPYLKELGVECLYLTPIFKGDFNHKYATTDYFEIDTAFGTREEFRTLVEKCHTLQMHILLDGVFNHTGIHFMAFADILEKQERSIYKDWYYINKFPIAVSHHNYECVGAYKWMPKLNTSNPQVRAYILSVMEYWILEYGIDGWRLDVADEVDGTVWQEASVILKEKYPNIFLLGETWGDGGKLLQVNQMDSVMNYLFRDIVKDYFGRENISMKQFDERINLMLSRYKREINLRMYNLLDSHDTERFLTYCAGDKSRLKLAVAFQFLFPGSPAIYYGDEVSMTGDNDPDCRKTMLWDETADTNMLDWYRMFSKIRKEHQIIRSGSYATILRDEEKDIFGFIRSYQKEEIYILFHKAEGKESINCPLLKGGRYQDLLSGEELIGETKSKCETYFNEDIVEYEAIMNVTLSSYSVKVIIKQKEDM